MEVKHDTDSDSHSTEWVLYVLEPGNPEPVPFWIVTCKVKARRLASELREFWELDDGAITAKLLPKSTLKAAVIQGEVESLGRAICQSYVDWIDCSDSDNPPGAGSDEQIRALLIGSSADAYFCGMASELLTREHQQSERNDTEDSVSQPESSQPPRTEADTVDKSQYRKGIWFDKATAGLLSSGAIRKAVSDGRLKKSINNGRRWSHDVDEVCKVWQEHSDAIQSVLI